MQCNKNADLKIFEIWVSKDERKALTKSKQLARLYEICNECGYKPVMFVCGSNDLINNTAQMIKRRANDNIA